MKRYYKTSILLTLILIGIFSTFIIQNGVSQTLYSYQASRDTLFDTSSISYYQTFNMRNQTLSTQLYNASYSFTSETGLVDDEPTFISSVAIPTNCYDEVISSYYNHSEVLEIHDGYASGKPQIWHDFLSVISYGTIEFWLLSDDPTYHTYIDFRHYTGGRAFEFGINADAFEYSDSGGFHSFGSVDANTWYHVSIDFESTTGSYKGLSQYYWQFRINGVAYGSYTFETNTNLEYVFTQGNSADNGYSWYLDAIGMSWLSNYTESVNSYVYFNATNTLEVARDEFAFNETAQQTPLGEFDDELNDWHVFAFATSPDPEVIQSNESYDREIKLHSNGGGYTSIYKPLDSVLSGAFNFSTDFSYWDCQNSDSGIYFIISTSGGASEILLLRIWYKSGALTMAWADSGYTYTTIGNVNQGKWTHRVLNIYADEYQDFAVLRYSENSTLIYHELIPLRLLGQDFRRFYIWNFANDNSGNNIHHLDSAGVWNEGIEMNNDYFVNFYNGSKTDWNGNNHNLVEINATGYFNYGIYNNSNFNTPKWFYNYSGNKLWNVYNTNFSINNAELVFLSNQSYTVNRVLVHGVKLTRSGTDYFPVYTFGNTDLDESYFYVEGNSIYYTITYNDTDLEYIQADFDVPNVYTDNYTISYNSATMYDGYAYFGFEFTDDTTYTFPFSTTLAVKSYYLNAHKTVDKFIIAITDNDELDSNIGTGRIKDINLVWVTNYTFTLTTLSLMDILIVILIMFVPSLLVSFKYGKKFILPMFILMSVICFATSLIPAWLFFLMLFGFIGFIFIKGRGGYD